jgi:hypothetical protein
MTFLQKFGFITFVIFLSGNVSAQEILNETNELPQIILERDWYHFSQGIIWNQYQYLDGTLLKYKNVRSIISVVPENQKVLRQERGWLVTNTVSTILFFSSWCVWAVYTNDDFPHASLMRQITGYTNFVTFFTAIYAKEIRNHKMSRAVTNYNLYIQGMPIP